MLELGRKVEVFARISRNLNAYIAEPSKMWLKSSSGTPIEADSPGWADSGTAEERSTSSP